MFMETPQTLLYLTGGAFLLGWLVGKIGAYFGRKITDKKRDPRDDRIRSLEAELRIAKSETGKIQAELENKIKEFAVAQKESVDLEQTINTQLDLTSSLRQDLKDSVKQTRELRADLSDRAAENIKSEVKLREVETELSVAQASTDLLGLPRERVSA